MLIEVMIPLGKMGLGVARDINAWNKNQYKSTGYNGEANFDRSMTVCEAMI